METNYEPEQVLTTAKRTLVLCPRYKHLFNYQSKLSSISNCAICPSFNGLITYPKTDKFPRVLCSENGLSARNLDTICGLLRNHTVLNCKLCKFFQGLEVSTGYLHCSSDSKKPKFAYVLPKNVLLTIELPYLIPCAKTGITVALTACIECEYFKAIDNRYPNKKVRCTHPKAVSSEYINRLHA